MEKNLDFTFLTDQQIWGDDQGQGQLQVMKSYGTKTGMSDLAIVLGGLIGNGAKTSDNQLSGSLWSASSGGDGLVRTVDGNGDRFYDSPYERLCGARPALPSSVASSIRLSEAKPSRKISGVDVVEYGEYPQTIASKGVNKELEKALKAGKLQATGKKYTFDGEKSDAYDKPFSAKEYAEYQHNGKRYIRVEAQPVDNDSVLSNGRKPETGEVCWIEVQPIEWLKDPTGVMVARQALFSGVQFDRNKSYDGNFAKTDMKQYLDRFFTKEMLPQQEVKQYRSTGGSNDTKQELGFARAQDKRGKDTLRPIIRAAFEALNINVADIRLETALDAALAKQQELSRKRG